jgi:hypothetical protein
VIICLRDDSILAYAGRRDQKMIQPNPNPNPATNSFATIRIRYLFGTENTPDHPLFFIKSSQSILRIPTVEESMMISNARTTTQTAQHPTSYDRTHVSSPSSLSQSSNNLSNRTQILLHLETYRKSIKDIAGPESLSHSTPLSLNDQTSESRLHFCRPAKYDQQLAAGRP